MNDTELGIQELYIEAQQLGRAAERASLVADIRQALGLDDSRHARQNLGCVLFDMKASGRADRACLTIVARVIKQIAVVERIIERDDHAQPEPVTREGEG